MGGRGIRDSDLGRWIAAFLFMAVAATWLATADFPMIDDLQFISSEEHAVSSGHRGKYFKSRPGPGEDAGGTVGEAGASDLRGR